MSIFGSHISEIVLLLMLESSMFYTCAFTSSHIMKDPSGAKRLEGPDAAKGPEVHVGAIGTTNQAGVVEMKDPSRARGIFEFWIFLHYLCLKICVSASSPHIFLLVLASHLCVFSYRHEIILSFYQGKEKLNIANKLILSLISVFVVLIVNCHTFLLHTLSCEIKRLVHSAFA